MAKILIVDDDAQTIALLETIIKANRHNPTSVSQSRNAIATAESIFPDLILLDIMMDEINGIDLCKMIKTNKNLNHIPVIMVSALDDDKSKNDSFNAGAKSYITKPFLAKDFIAKINATIEESQLSQ